MNRWGPCGVCLALNVSAGAFFILVAGFPFWPVVGVSGFIWIFSFAVGAIMGEL